MRFSAIIPARSGSTRLKGKNFKLLCGKPMIAWTIEAALKSKCFDEIIISTNDHQVVKICEGYEDVKILNRPDELCLNDTSSDQVINHALAFLKNVDGFFLLQPTSPLRLPEHIIEAKNIFEFGFDKYKSDALISVSTRIINKNWFVVVCRDTGVVLHRNMPGYDLGTTKFLNGSIYVNTITGFKEKLTIKSKNTLVYEMPPELSVDVDELSHFLESQDRMLRHKYFKLNMKQTEHGKRT